MVCALRPPLTRRRQEAGHGERGEPGHPRGLKRDTLQPVTDWPAWNVFQWPVLRQGLPVEQAQGADEAANHAQSHDASAGTARRGGAGCWGETRRGRPPPSPTRRPEGLASRQRPRSRGNSTLNYWTLAKNSLKR